MNDFQFVRYEPTPGEKYLGIATVKAFGKIVLRYKIVQNKEGKGYFPACASYKVVDYNGADKYVSAFMLDSNSDKEELENLIRSNVRQYINNSPSVFNNGPVAQSTQPVQPNPNYAQYPQQVRTYNASPPSYPVESQPQQNYYTSTQNGQPHMSINQQDVNLPF